MEGGRKRRRPDREAEGSRGRPPPQLTRGLEERRKLSHWGPEQRPDQKQFWCMLSVAECLRMKKKLLTRNTLDCDQSNVYSSRVVFSAIS